MARMAVDMSSEELRSHLFRSLQGRGVLDSLKVSCQCTYTYHESCAQMITSAHLNKPLTLNKCG